MNRAGAVRLLAVGDNVAIGHERGLRFFYEKVTSTLRVGDLTFGNLEWPIGDSVAWDPRDHGRPLYGHMTPDDAEALSKAGFSVVSIANNHIMDYGADGLLQTLQHLDRQGVRACGAGVNFEEAHRPVFLTRRQLKVAFLAYTSVFVYPSYPVRPPRTAPQMATLEVSTRYEPSPRIVEQPATPMRTISCAVEQGLAAVQREIRAARQAADFVLVSWHWGVSDGHRKRATYQSQVGRACIDAGAHLVVGHHPHVLQGIETYRRGVICYSLGNFAFWLGRDPTADEMAKFDPFSAIVDCEFDKGGIRSINFVPVLLNARFQPEVVTDDQGAVVYDALRKDSEEFGTGLHYSQGRISLRL